MNTQYSTGIVDPARRFEYWNDVVCRHCIPAASRMLESGAFDARLTVQSIGAVDISEMAAPWHQWTRAAHHLRAGAHDDIWLGYLHQGSALVGQEDRQAVLHNGDMVLYDAARSFEFSLVSKAAFLIRLPRQALLQRFPDAERMTARTLDGAKPGVGPLRSMILQAAAVDFGTAHSASAARFGSTLLDLVGIALEFQNDVARESTPERDLYARLVNYIQCNFKDPNLGLDRLAASQHVSSRTVTRAFAKHNQTAMGMVWNLRLEASQQALAEGRVRSVTDAAFDHGFSDASHFSRVFRSAYGYAPHLLIRKH